MEMRVADYFAQTLEKMGVRGVFLLSGGGMMHLVDAIGRQKHLKYYCNHHEQASAYAAEGYARQSGQLGVCYATSGPGATNIVTGVLTAWQDSTPTLFVTGQSKVSETIRGTKLFGLRQFGVFEVDILPVVESITKYAVFLDDPKKARYHFEKACYLATAGRPGPVLIDVPLNVQGALIDPDKLPGFDPDKEGLSARDPVQSDDEIDGVLDRLARAQRPLILAGHGLSCAGDGAREVFQILVERLNIPVITTQLGTHLLAYDHPLYVGHPGVKGDRAGNFAIQNADVLLTLGSSLHILTTGYEYDQFAPGAYKIQVELDPMVLKRERVGVQQKINISIQIFMDRMENRLKTRGSSTFPIASGKWHEMCHLWKHDLAVKNEPHVRDNGINYYDFIDVLSDQCGPADTIISDAGSAYFVVGQAFRVKQGQKVIISGALGQMGYALPATSGACVAAPERRVVCVTGDGSLQMNIHELATIRHNQFNAKLFIINNGGYVSIRNTQKSFFGGNLVGSSEQSGVLLPDHGKIASAYGLPYRAIRCREELTKGISGVLDTKGPVLCEVFTMYDQQIIPTVSSIKLPDGRMVSKPLHDMAPFMDDEKLEKYQIKS